MKRLVDKHSPHIEGSLKRADILLEEILASGREANLDAREFDITQVLKRAGEGVFRMGVEKSIRLRQEISGPLRIFGDESKFERVFENILNNAVEAMKGAGQIWISAKETTEHGRAYLLVCIGNSGTFISPAEGELIFQPFFTKRKAEGVGLGLAICKSIVEAHSGEIWCKSEANKGAEFFIKLPLTEAPEID